VSTPILKGRKLASGLTTLQRRRSFLRDYLDPQALEGLEIGPLDKPVVLKSQGSIKYLDYLSYDELLKRHEHEGTRTSEIVAPDLVVPPKKRLSEVIGEDFDYIIACHVIEHIPDVIGWLVDMCKILRLQGFLFLAVPDKRYTFDILRPETSLGHLLQDYYRQVNNADFEYVFDHINMKREVSSAEIWDGKAYDKIKKPRFSKAEALLRSLREMAPDHYSDVHCHVFSSTGFLQIIKDLIDLQIIDFSLYAFEDTSRPYNEFLVLLKRGPDCGHGVAHHSMPI